MPLEHGTKLLVPTDDPDPSGYLPLPALVRETVPFTAAKARFHRTRKHDEYLLQYDVPTGTGTSFFRLRVIGRAERHAYVYQYCRVRTVVAEYLVFPASLDLAAQRTLLDKLAHAEHKVFRADPKAYVAALGSDDEPATTMTADRLLATKAPGVRVLSTTDYERNARAVTGDRRPAYVERTPSSSASSSATAPTKTTLATLASNYGPNVRVKELDATHVVHRDEDPVRAGWFGAGPACIQPATATMHLERYLNDPQRMAVVAVAPENQYLDEHERVRDPTADRVECRVPVSGDSIVGVALFERIAFAGERVRQSASRQPSRTASGRKRPTRKQPHRACKQRRASRSASHPPTGANTAKATPRPVLRPTTIRMHAFAVDYAYDEEVRVPGGKHDPACDGIKYRFLAAAMQHARAVYGDHDIVCTSSDPGLRATLRTFGFREHGAAVRVANTSAYQWPWKTHALVFPAIAMQCTTWKECVALIKERYPEMSLKERMVKAKDFYTNKPATRDAKSDTSPGPKRSHRKVSPATGVTVLCDYYAHKHLLPNGIDLKQADLRALDDATLAHVRTYATAVRRHLERTRKVEVLSGARTYLFRPEPHRAITATAQHGPDAYYLEGLDKTTEPGRTLHAYPLGKRRAWVVG